MQIDLSDILSKIKREAANDEEVNAKVGEIAGRLLAKIKANTPIGAKHNYGHAKSVGQITAVSRANKRLVDSSYSFNVAKGYWVVRVTNPIVHLVEYGHLSRNGGWVQGRYFITKAVEQIRAELNG